MPNTTPPAPESPETLQDLLNAVMNAERKYARLGAKADKAMAKANEAKTARDSILARIAAMTKGGT